MLNLALFRKSFLLHRENDFAFDKNDQKWITEGLTQVDNSFGVFLQSVRTILLHKLHTSYKHYVHKLACAPEWITSVGIPFVMVLVFWSSRPFSWRLHLLVEEENSVSFAFRYFEHRRYSLPSITIFLTSVPVHCSTNRTWCLTSSGALSLVFKWTALTWLKHSSI